MKKTSPGLNRRRGVPRYLLVVILLAAVAIGGQFAFPDASASVLRTAARPLWQSGASIGGWWHDARTFFTEKQALSADIERLKQRTRSLEHRLDGYAALKADYERLQDLLGRPARDDATALARVLAGPGRSPYDTLVLDIGRADGITEGSRVTARGGAVLGTIADADERTATVQLYSAPGVVTDVRLGATSTPVSIEGRGGGSFFAQVPRGVSVAEGTAAFLPDAGLSVIATVVSVETERGDALQRLYLSAPVNVFEIQWVLVDTTAS